MPGTGRKFSVALVTPDGAAYEGDAEMIIVPGADGEVGVLARHAPLIATLKAGSTRIHPGDGSDVLEFATGPGFFQVLQDRAIALVDDAVNANEIDDARAREQLETARAELEARPLHVDLLHEHRVVHQRDRAILFDFEETGARRVFLHAIFSPADVDARRARLQRRDQRRVAREHADLPGGARNDEHHGFAFERRAVGRDERDGERLVGHYAVTGSRSCSGSGSGSASRVSSPASLRPFSTAPSIGPTM